MIHHARFAALILVTLDIIIMMGSFQTSSAFTTSRISTASTSTASTGTTGITNNNNCIWNANISTRNNNIPNPLRSMNRGRNSNGDHIRINTFLAAQKQSRSTLLNPPAEKAASTDKSRKNEKSDPSVKDSNAAEAKESEEIYGAKFFGGNAIKEELFDEALEEQADKLLSLYSGSKAKPEGTDVEGGDGMSIIYSRFMDENAFCDSSCRILAQRLQDAINHALYLSPTQGDNEDDVDEDASYNDDNSRPHIYSKNLDWKTPFSRSKESKNPLEELTHSLEFYKRVDVAIVSARTLPGGDNDDGKVKKVQFRWEISVIWPNLWGSRVLLTGTSDTTVDMERMMILTQIDKLDCGGKDGQDVIQAIAGQIQPRFWDLYHIGMTPSAEFVPRMNANANAKSRGIFSNYRLFEIPPRLVLQPCIADEGGREARDAEALPNHAFSCAIKTTGPKAQRYTTTSPVEVSIRRVDGKSMILWNIPLPPEFVSYHDSLPLGEHIDNDTTSKYVFQSKRFVATLPYGGSAQDKEITDIRKDLYEQVVRDGLKPKLLEGRPQFFFLNHDTKACFTADGGLGMAVYEWRPKLANSNEVGIELELD